MRVSHPWAGKNFGAIHIPRMGQEVVVDLVVSRCTEAESAGRVIDSILTNTVLPRISVEYLNRLSEGRALKRIRLSVRDGQFAFGFH